MCDVFERMKYSPNEVHLSYNKLTNIAFNATMDYMKSRVDDPHLLSYPQRVYKIKFGPLMQNEAPLWLRMDHNYINVKEAQQYMKSNEISVCYANKYKPKKRLQSADKMSVSCDPMHCICPATCNYYQQQLDEYLKQQENKKHTNANCKVCSKARKKTMKGKGKSTKVVLCKRCRNKAKLIREEEREEEALAAKVDQIIEDKKLNIDEKIAAMERLSQEQDKKNKTDEQAFSKSVVKPAAAAAAADAWVWGTDDSDDKKSKSETSIRFALFENEFFMESICELPSDFSVPMVHLYRFSNQLMCAQMNEKVAQAIFDNKDDEEEKEKKKKKTGVEEKIENNLPSVAAAKSSTCVNRKEYLANMVRLSQTPLFIMCDTCSILCMVALQKKSAMNYWETMLTQSQKMKYILHFTIRDALKKGTFLLNSEAYQRNLRLDILPKLQLHLTTEEIKSIANDLIKVPFKKYSKKSHQKSEVYSAAKHKDIVIGQMYRFIALFGDKLPQQNAEKHKWQQVMEEHVFNKLGFECPQELMPRFITEIRKLTKQYQYQNKLESAKRFTLNTLIDKASNGEFGFDICRKSEQSCILIPHTVAMELEHIKTARGNKSKGDLWRVQQLCGSGGLLESLCKKSGCDVLGSEDGEAHLKCKSQSNDYTIISVAEHYSKLLNTQSNLGFVLLTNDKAMYTIASGKGVPVVSLNTLNAKLQEQQVRDDDTIHPWNASYLREMMIEVGFVGGFAKKHLINDAVAVLQRDDDEPRRSEELEVRRQQVAVYQTMEEAYAMELFGSMTLTNELLLTLQGVLENGESATMKQVYKNKVLNLQRTVCQTHQRWSAIIEEYQKRRGSQLQTQEENVVDCTSESDSEDSSNENNAVLQAFVDNPDVPEMQVFHAEDMNEVDGHYVDAYNLSGDQKKSRLKITESRLKNEEKEGNYNHNVPLIGGYLAGEELFSRQANGVGFEEEIVMITHEV
eukprot:139770_1